MTRRVAIGSRTLGVAAVGLAVLLSIAGVPVTSAQGQTLFSRLVQGPLPVDTPWDPAWDGAAPVDVLLSGQSVTTPRMLQPAIPALRVRSLFDGQAIAVMLEWRDTTLDDSVLASDRFADAAAVQFALGSGTSVCMGQQAGGLNIWHWKADWAADLGGRRDVQDVHPGMPTDVRFPADTEVGGLGPEGFETGRAAGNTRSAARIVSSVEDLNAIGFGTLTPQSPDGQNVHGASEHRGTIWRVVMSRPLWDGDPNDVLLAPGAGVAVVAFAIWDGSHGDRNGQKSVSTWLALSLSEPPA